MAKRSKRSVTEQIGSRSGFRSHNYELFEFVKILSLKNVVQSGEIPKGQRPAFIHCVRASGYQDHAAIAMSVTNNYIIVRYTGENGTPIIRNVKWFAHAHLRILDMCWCPSTHHLLILGADMTIILIPILNILLRSDNQEIQPKVRTPVTKRVQIQRVDPKSPIGAPSHLGPSDAMTIYSSITKTSKIHDTGHIFWWRTCDRTDYAISISERGTIRFTNLHTQELKKANTMRLNTHFPRAYLINDRDVDKYLLLQETGGAIRKIFIERKVSTGSSRTIFNMMEAKSQVASQPFRKSVNTQGVNISVRTTDRGTLIGLYFPSTNKLEVHSADLQKFPLYVYQLYSCLTFAHLTEKLTFAVSYLKEEQCSRVFVTSNLISSTSEVSTNSIYFGRQREAIMQEFKFHNQRIRGCFPAFRPKETIFPQAAGLEGFFVWTRDGIYECRPKLRPEQIFFQLVGQGLEKTDAEKLGTTVGLDVLELYEIAADKYFEAGEDGKALK